MRTATRTLLARSAACMATLAAALPALAQGGTITGKVDATPPRYLEETVVYLKQVPGTYQPKTADMDQKGMKFIPHIMTVTKGDTVKFLNHDNVAHNIYSPDNEGYNLGTFKQNEERTYTFSREGAYSQLCSIHPEMLAFIFVGQNPYSAIVDKTGKYTIKNVPAGSYKLSVWNSHLKAADKNVVVAAGQTLANNNFSLKR